MAAPYSVEEALQKYESDKLAKERTDRENEIMEKLHKQIMEKEKHRKKISEEDEKEIECIAYKTKLEADNPAGVIFDTICNLIETNETIQTNILRSIAATGSTKVELVDTPNYNVGIIYHHGLCVDLSKLLSTRGHAYSDDEIIGQFKNYRYVVKNEKFKDWIISSDTYYGLAYVFLFIVPEVRLRITMQPPSSISKFFSSLFS